MRTLCLAARFLCTRANQSAERLSFRLLCWCCALRGQALIFGYGDVVDDSTVVYFRSTRPGERFPGVKGTPNRGHCCLFTRRSSFGVLELPEAPKDHVRADLVFGGFVLTPITATRTMVTMNKLLLFASISSRGALHVCGASGEGHFSNGSEAGCGALLPAKPHFLQGRSFSETLWHSSTRTHWTPMWCSFATF